jgi:exosortase D (VPLPA-CTERM-specific)
MLAVVLVTAFAIIFDDAFSRMVSTEWQADEYQHAFIIPLVSLYLIWMRASDLQRVPFEPSWLGVAMVVLGLGAFLLGELSAIYAVIWYGFLFAFWGFVVATIGVRASAVIWAGLLYLVFMIPLPQTLLASLSGTFQLWSSQLGAAFLRLIGVSVYLEGNVIDLGSYKLQVVEACSGLRYLFPLASFSFFCGYIFRGPLWQRIFIFLSAIPITIVMNSFRISVTGVLVDQFGTGQAEGFLHYFEGWLIFVACIALLFLEMALFSMRSQRKLADSFAVEIPDARDFRFLIPTAINKPAVVCAFLLIVAGAAGSLAIERREEFVPAHVALSAFPLRIGEWSGNDSSLEAEVLGELKLTDYLMTTFHAGDNPVPVQLYIAYYESQRTGATMHSPRACLPGGGWQIQELSRREMPGIRPDGLPLPVNRMIIGRGSDKALVYYWFVQRGRYLTSEYVVKFYNFWDSLTRSRTDGALVRVMTPLVAGTPVEDAERHLVEFIRAAEPKIYYHLPQDSAVQAKPAGAAAASRKEALIANPVQAAGNSD